MIPAPSNTPLPDKTRCPEQKAKLFSVYLRPWVLDPAKACAQGHVPHIRDLDLARRASKPLRRVLTKTTSDCEPELRSYSEAWSTYVRGRVVSRHAARLITQFMAACCGKSKRDDAMPETTEKEAQELPDNSVPLARVHRLLDALSAKEKTCSKDSSTAVKDAAAESGGESEREAEEVNKKAMRRTAQMQTALQITADLWNRNAAPWQGVELHPEAVDWANQTATAEQKRKRQLLTQKQVLKSGVKLQCRAYVKYQKRDVDAWKKNLMQSPEAPNKEQAAFLDRVLKRCEEEHAELGHPSKGIIKDGTVDMEYWKREPVNILNIMSRYGRQCDLGAALSIRDTIDTLDLNYRLRPSTQYLDSELPTRDPIDTLDLAVKYPTPKSKL